MLLGDDTEVRLHQVGTGLLLGLPVVLLILTGWCLVIASIVLDGVSDHWDGSAIVNELSHYSWKGSTADAVIASFFTAVISTWALFTHHPKRGLYLSVAVFLVLAVKAAKLQRTGAALGCAALASLSALSTSGALTLKLCAQRHADLRGRNSTLLGGEMDGVNSVRSSTRSSGKTATGATVMRLLALARPERCLLILATFALAGASASQMAMPALIGVMLRAVDKDSASDPHSAYHKLGRAALSLVLIFSVGGCFTFLRGFLYNFCGERLVARLRARLFQKMISLDISFFDQNKTGELINRRVASRAEVSRSGAAAGQQASSKSCGVSRGLKASSKKHPTPSSARVQAA